MNTLMRATITSTLPMMLFTVRDVTIGALKTQTAGFAYHTLLTKSVTFHVLNGILTYRIIFGLGGQCASSCQISSKSAKRLQRYGDLTVFKMAAVRHLGFVKFELVNDRSG